MALGFPKVVEAEEFSAATLPRPEVREEELHRQFARELHDQVAQPLVSLVLEVRKLRDQNAAGEPIDEELVLLEDSVRGVLRHTREMLIDQRGQSALRLDFAAALRNELPVSDAYLVTVEVSSRWPRHINGWAAFNLLRIVQHAITNSARHGRAQHIDIRLDVAPDDEAIVVVRDDGAGVDGALPGIGLIGMRERATILGGTMHVMPVTGGGTRVEVRVPVYRLA